MGLFYNDNGEESQNKKNENRKPNKSIKEKLNVKQSHTLGNWEQG